MVNSPPPLHGRWLPAAFLVPSASACLPVPATMLDLIISTSGKLVEIYEDKDIARKDEISNHLSSQVQTEIFPKFYDRLKEIRDYHRNQQLNSLERIWIGGACNGCHQHRAWVWKAQASGWEDETQSTQGGHGCCSGIGISKMFFGDVTNTMLLV
ncbi:hypothetical protein GUJ93_ZPchr0005g15767 [Zizania palustris]|uniref:Splicing factor SF3a60 binding domain-containing protein n=1 Tax=Zizania palustris TaxID=103762 RepID=A0A8J5S5M7_ZIZPA|nr:hypothetical protein GUJ93_ZPchr0005g15767 [Zizania palustris]